MDFMKWLVMRAWKPVVGYWNRPAIEGEQCSGKEEIAGSIIIAMWLVSTAIGIIFGAFIDAVWFTLAGVALAFLILVAYIPDAYKYLSKLHAQYRAENPAEKPKRKRKRSTEAQSHDDWASDIVDTLFEGIHSIDDIRKLKPKSDITDDVFVSTCTDCVNAGKPGKCSSCGEGDQISDGR